MKNYNIVWILVDSVRTYYSNDDRSRIKIMDKFAENALEFKNVITSAPSTIMSINSMMTSIPAYFLGRTYDEYFFDEKFFKSFRSILEENGWNSQAIIMLPEIREKLNILNLLEKKYLPKTYSYTDSWNNRDIFKILENTLEIQKDLKSKKPYFWFLDFNCRNDNQTSNIVENSIDILIKYGFNTDNTIFILCSDHGYPDPSSGITPEILKKKNLTHDMFMTDDNIKIPLIMSYPDCKKNHKITDLCSSLDIMPTILDLLEIKVSKHITQSWHGKSLVDTINCKNVIDNERSIRVDARFLGQDQRVTAIRNNNNKLLYFHDKDQFELFEVGENYLNEKKIDKNHNKEIFLKLKKDFDESELLAYETQVKYSLHKLKKKFKDFKNANSILIIYSKETLYSILKNSINQINENIEISFINLNKVDKVYEKKFDILLIITNENNDHINNLIKKLKYEKKIILDSNMIMKKKSGRIIRFFKELYKNKNLYIQEPKLIFLKIVKALRSSLNRQ